jgi:hypothetical protein
MAEAELGSLTYLVPVNRPDGTSTFELHHEQVDKNWRARVLQLQKQMEPPVTSIAVWNRVLSPKERDALSEALANGESPRTLGIELIWWEADG